MVLGLSEPLLPNLRKLYWDHHLGPLQAYLLPMCPRLSHLTVNLTAIDNMDLSMLALMGNVGPSIISLIIWSDEPEIDNTRQTCLSNFVTQLESLRCFESSVPLQPQCVAQLATMSSLRRLWLNIGDQGEVIAELCRDQGNLVFKNMKEWELVLSDIPNFLAFLDTIPLAQVHYLELSMYRGDDTATIQNLFSLLKSGGTSSFTLLKLEETGDTRHLVSDVMGLAIFRPLFSLRGLRHLDISTFHAYQLDDVALRDMSQAWPLLEFLELGSCGWRGQSQCTWTGIMALLHHCRNLREVAIAICTTEGCSLEIITSGFVRYNSLVRINFLDSPITSDPHQVAVFLSQLSLNLSVVQAWNLARGGQGRQSKKWRPVWAEVQAQLNRCVEVREDETRRARAIH